MAREPRTKAALRQANRVSVTGSDKDLGDHPNATREFKSLATIAVARGKYSIDTAHTRVVIIPICV